MDTLNPFFINCHHRVYLNNKFNDILQVQDKTMIWIGIIWDCYIA
jgi:hypothetical protein